MKILVLEIFQEWKRSIKIFSKPGYITRPYLCNENQTIIKIRHVAAAENLISETCQSIKAVLDYMFLPLCSPKDIENYSSLPYKQHA